MKTTKTIQSGVVELTKVKKEELNNMWSNFQKFLRGEDREVYSAHKQQAKRYYDKIKEDREYPISLRKDLVEVRECDSDIADYFIKIPSKQRYGGIKVPIRTHQEIPENAEIGESKLYKKDNRYFVNITISYSTEPVTNYKGVLGIDLGLRNPVTSVALPDSTVKFLGHQIRDIQAKYYYLRKNSSNDKSWRQREYNKVRDNLHKLTTKMADYCKEHKLMPVVGNLEGIQKQNKGRAMNRKLHRFPHYTFKKMLEYKCKERGLVMLEVDEKNTSKKCSKCDEFGSRYKGRFRCNGTETNSDVNGAYNICKRGLSKLETKSLDSLGASVTMPELLSVDRTSATASS